MSRRHLVGTNRRDRAACGVSDPRVYTTEPERVTCDACSRSFDMAVAELTAAQKRKQRNPRGRRSVD